MRERGMVNQTIESLQFIISNQTKYLRKQIYCTFVIFEFYKLYSCLHNRLHDNMETGN